MNKKIELEKGGIYLVQQSYSGSLIEITIIGESELCYKIQYMGGHIAWEYKSKYTGEYSQNKVIEKIKS